MGCSEMIRAASARRFAAWYSPSALITMARRSRSEQDEDEDRGDEGRILPARERRERDDRDADPEHDLAEVVRVSRPGPEARLDESIARWNLLESKFYQAWSAGTLPVEALRTYAAEYGAFISLIPRGWEGHGDTATATVEREHMGMWGAFAQALGTEVGAAQTPGEYEAIAARNPPCRGE